MKLPRFPATRSSLPPGSPRRAALVRAAAALSAALVLLVLGLLDRDRAAPPRPGRIRRRGATRGARRHFPELAAGRDFAAGGRQARQRRGGARGRDRIRGRRPGGGRGAHLILSGPPTGPGLPAASRADRTGRRHPAAARCSGARRPRLPRPARRLRRPRQCAACLSAGCRRRTAGPHPEPRRPRPLCRPRIRRTRPQAPAGGGRRARRADSPATPALSGREARHGAQVVYRMMMFF